MEQNFDQNMQTNLPQTPSKFPTWAIIVLVVVGAGLIIGLATYLFTKNNQQITSNNKLTPAPTQTENAKSQQIIFGNAQVDKTNDHEPLTNVDFYSVNLDGSNLTKLFSLSAAQLNKDSAALPFTFCPATKKIYLPIAELIKNTPYNNSYLEEIDMNGNIRNLKFMEEQASQYKTLEYMDTGFALSPDCSKIIWSTAYFQYTNYQKTGAYNEIYISDINGQNKKVLLSTQENPTNEIKWVYKWSAQNPNLVYLTDYDWNRNGGGGGLFTLDTTSGQIKQITQVPSRSNVYDISQDETKVTYASNITSPITSGVTLNLTDGSTTILANDSNGKRLFSPLGDKLANVVPMCSGVGAQAACTPNLYLYSDGQNNKIAVGVDLLDWLSENVIIGSNSNTIVSVNADGSGTKNIATANDYLNYIGITK